MMKLIQPIYFIRKILAGSLVFLIMSSAVNATVTFYTSKSAWEAAVSASALNLQVSTFVINHTNASLEGNGHTIPALPDPAVVGYPAYYAIRTNSSLPENSVNLGRRGTFNSANTGFITGFEISTVQSDARIYYNDTPGTKTNQQIDALTDVLSIGKFNSDDDDDFTLEVTSGPAVYAVAFDLANNKQSTTDPESLEVFASKADTGTSAFDNSDGTSLARFGAGGTGVIPGYTGGYSENFDKVHFVGVVSTTPFKWLEFHEDMHPNDIGLKNIRFASPQTTIVDTDFDGIPDSTDNCPTNANPNQTDNDSDGTGNLCDAFPSNGSETKDSDNDGMGDNFETQNGLNPNSGADANLDPDDDGFTNLEEFQNGSNPNVATDSDKDGTPDKTDNCPAITNSNQLDSDHDGAGNACDAFPSNASETKDSDNDGMGDNFETQHGLNPNNSTDANLDPDGDGLTNLEEFQSGGDPVVSSAINQGTYHEDFNGDGKDDILWRHEISGANMVYLMDGNNIIESRQINIVADSDWQVVAIADLDGDNKDDIIWRHAVTGLNWIYMMDGTNIRQSIQLNQISDTNWQIAGIADFNGDGKEDMLWRNEVNGMNWVFIMNGSQVSQSQPLITVADTSWKVAGTTDLNSDGKDDIVWRHSGNGENYAFLMNGTNITSITPMITVADTNWQIAGTADINGDKKGDILWRNKVTGQNWILLMDGTQIIQSNELNTVADLQWHIAKVGDFDNDQKADIVWRNISTGQNWEFLLNGISIKTSQPLNLPTDTNWKIVPARE